MLAYVVLGMEYPVNTRVCPCRETSQSYFLLLSTLKEWRCADPGQISADQPLYTRIERRSKEQDLISALGGSRPVLCLLIVVKQLFNIATE